MLFAQVTTPPGTPVELTEQVLDQVRAHFLQESGVRSRVHRQRLQFRRPRAERRPRLRQPEGLGRGARQRQQHRASAIAARANKAFAAIRGAQVAAFAPPAVFELGNATGFDFELHRSRHRRPSRR